MRTTLLGLLSLALAGPAFATSELQLSSNAPVVLFLDGESVGTAQPHEPLLVDIDKGVHNLRIQGILGKDLYDRDLIFDDDTRTELVWQRKQLRLGQVVKLDPNRPPPPMTELPVVPEHPRAPEDAPPPPPPAPTKQAEAASPAPPAAPQTAAAPPPPAAPERPLAQPAEVDEVAAAPAPPAPEKPAKSEKRRAQEQTYAATAPPVRDVQAPPPVAGAGGGPMVIQAREGLDLKITHGTKLIRVTIEDGELVVVDGNGTEIRFPDEAEAW